jgi:hypothetical protein
MNTYHLVVIGPAGHQPVQVGVLQRLIKSGFQLIRRASGNGSNFFDFGHGEDSFSGALILPRFQNKVPHQAKGATARIAAPDFQRG